MNDFHIVGPDALKPKKKGRNRTLKKSNKSTKTKAIEDNMEAENSAEHLRKLEKENLY